MPRKAAQHVHDEQRREGRRRKRGGRKVRDREAVKADRRAPGWRPAPASAQPEPSALTRQLGRGRLLPQHAVAALPRLVILTATDLPCATTIAAVVPGDVDGLICAYLESDLYSAFGVWHERPRPVGEPGGAVDLADFGVDLHVAEYTRSPRAGEASDRGLAWRYFVTDSGRGRRRRWSRLDVGASVLHIRWQRLMQERLAGGQA